MNYIKVIKSGLNVTIQDKGRPGTQHLGVPVSGVLDPTAMRLSNALAGNPDDISVLEIALVGPTLEVDAESVRVALAGTRGQIELLGDEITRFPAHRSVRFVRGQRFRVSALTDSANAVLAVEGGFAVDSLYGSKSTYKRAGIGGYAGRALIDGDRLPLGLNAVEGREELQLSIDDYLDEKGPMRVILGPQKDYFTDTALRLFLENPFTITREADRMGLRLEGPLLEHARGYNIVSDGIVTGAVQVPGNGLPIILLADHQTTGGYPKIATVISADIPRLGRARPGDVIHFREVSIEEAQAARRFQETMVSGLIDTMVPAGGWLDKDALYRENLISGIEMTEQLSIPN